MYLIFDDSVEFHGYPSKPYGRSRDIDMYGLLSNLDFIVRPLSGINPAAADPEYRALVTQSAIWLTDRLIR